MNQKETHKNLPCGDCQISINLPLKYGEVAEMRELTGVVSDLDAILEVIQVGMKALRNGKQVADKGKMPISGEQMSLFNEEGEVSSDVAESSSSEGQFYKTYSTAENRNLPTPVKEGDVGYAESLTLPPSLVRCTNGNLYPALMFKYKDSKQLQTYLVNNYFGNDANLVRNDSFVAWMFDLLFESGWRDNKDGSPITNLITFTHRVIPGWRRYCKKHRLYEAKEKALDRQIEREERELLLAESARAMASEENSGGKKNREPQMTAEDLDEIRRKRMEALA